MRTFISRLKRALVPTPAQFRAQSLAQRGFSLLEILIVLGLIGGILAYLATRISGGSETARRKQNDTRAATIYGDLQLYKSDTGRYPTTAEGLDIVRTKLNKDEGFDKDAWDRPFQYELTAKGPRLISQGDNPSDPADDVMYDNGKPVATAPEGAATPAN